MASAVSRHESTALPQPLRDFGRVCPLAAGANSVFMRELVCCIIAGSFAAGLEVRGTGTPSCQTARIGSAA